MSAGFRTRMFLAERFLHHSYITPFNPTLVLAHYQPTLPDVGVLTLPPACKCEGEFQGQPLSRKATIAYYSQESDPATDSPSYFLKPAEAQRRVDSGYVIWVSETAVQQRGATVQSAIEKFAGWAIADWMKDSALNRGRVGQFTIGYPIPYAFEGHLKEPKASVINLRDTLHAI